MAGFLDFFRMVGIVCIFKSVRSIWSGAGAGLYWDIKICPRVRFIAPVSQNTYVLRVISTLD